jgi:hypothetical protein
LIVLADFCWTPIEIRRCRSSRRSIVSTKVSRLIDGRGYKVSGHELGLCTGGTLFDHVSPSMRIYNGKSQALEVVQRAYVLEKGHVTIEGAGRDLLSNEIVRKSFLGL